MRHTLLAIPEGGGELRHVGGPEPVGAMATWNGQSLLGASVRGITSSEIVWSGSYAEVEGGGVFEEDPRTWGAKGWDVLRARVESCERDLVIRPHARHVVSDVPGCRRLLESSWASERGALLCHDPASMVVPGMMGRIEDHLRRMYEAIELFPVQRLRMVVVAGVDANGAACGLDACGELGRTVAELADAWVPQGVAMAVPDRCVSEQIRMFRQG